MYLHYCHQILYESIVPFDRFSIFTKCCQKVQLPAAALCTCFLYALTFFCINVQHFSINGICWYGAAVFSIYSSIHSFIHSYSFIHIHSFICSITQLRRKSAATCTVEQDSKAKALTAAQKLQNYTKTIHRTKIKI